MQYVVTGRDGTDDGALARRMAVREDHIALGDKMRDAGKHIMGAALLNDVGDMCGSVLIVDFGSRAELDGWLVIEPYITGDVWRFVDIEPCKIGPSFATK